MSESWHSRCRSTASSPTSCTRSRSRWPCRRTTGSRGRSSIKVADLHDETLLLLEDGHCLRDQALDICSGTGVHEKQDFRATSLETLRQMVAAGVGITLLPELAGRGAYGAARGVTIKPFAKPVPTRTIGAVWRKSSARRAVILALAKQIEAHAL